MSDIHKNLKQLRTSRNLTQEDVAQQIGVTRQAISSYESGRTQPGIDLLMQFSDIYKVSLDEILYGEKKENKELKRLKIISSITASICLIAQSINILLYIISHTFYPIPIGQVPDSMEDIVEIHFKLSKAADLFEGIGYDTLFIGGLILLILDLTMKTPINLKRKLIYIGILIICSLLIASIGGIILPLWRANFFIIARLGIYIILLYFVIDTIGQQIKTLFKKKKG